MTPAWGILNNFPNFPNFPFIWTDFLKHYSTADSYVVETAWWSEPNPDRLEGTMHVQQVVLNSLRRVGL